MKKSIVRISLFAFALAIGAVPAFAQDTQRVEVGGSLANLIVTLPEGGGSHSTLFGVPSGGFGMVNPAVYAAFFVHPRVAIEPQLGMIVVSNHGTNHWINFMANVDYFAGDVKKSSPFIFTGGGVIAISDEDSMKAIDGGAGYRFRVGDRLTFRVDGRYTHFFDHNGNMVSFTLSIGGLLGK